MLHRLIDTLRDFARCKADQPATFALFARDTVSGFVTTTHYALVMLGVAAIAALGMMFAKPNIAGYLEVGSLFANATQKTSSAAPLLDNLMANPVKPGQPLPTATKESSRPTSAEKGRGQAGEVSHQQQWVTSWISKRYRVANEATHMLVSAAYVTAKEIKLDPSLILAVVAIESRFNPFAESPVGAQGLMQVMSKVHHEKFQDLGGVKAALNPVANIKVGSLILKDYVTRAGSVEAGLKLYVGAAKLESDFGYGTRVMAEYRRLKEVANGKKVPIFATTASTVARKSSSVDKAETAKNESAELVENVTEQVTAL